MLIVFSAIHVHNTILRYLEWLEGFEKKNLGSFAFLLIRERKKGFDKQAIAADITATNPQTDPQDWSR